VAGAERSANPALAAQKLASFGSAHAGAKSLFAYLLDFTNLTRIMHSSPSSCELTLTFVNEPGSLACRRSVAKGRPVEVNAAGRIRRGGGSVRQGGISRGGSSARRTVCAFGSLTGGSRPPGYRPLCPFRGERHHAANLWVTGSSRTAPLRGERQRLQIDSANFIKTRASSRRTTPCSQLAGNSKLKSRGTRGRDAQLKSLGTRASLLPNSGCIQRGGTAIPWGRQTPGGWPGIPPPRPQSHPARGPSAWRPLREASAGADALRHLEAGRTREIQAAQVMDRPRGSRHNTPPTASKRHSQSAG